MDRLSTELIVLILRHLEEYDLLDCTLVNRQFHSLANPILWQQLYIQDETSFNQLQKTLADHPQYSEYIKTIRLGPLGVPRRKYSLSPVIPLMPNLVRLQVNRATEETFSMAQLATECTQLGSLKFYRGTLASLAPLRDMNALRELDLFGCNLQDPTWFLFLPPLLTKLTIQRCIWQDKEDMTALATMAELQQLTSLEYMDRYDSSQLMTKTWPRLTCLQLNPCHSTNDTTMSFIQRHPQLVKLGLVDGKFTDTTLDAIATHLPGILYLDICSNTNITSHGVRRLVQQCKDLVKLDLHGSHILAEDFPELNLGLWRLDEFMYLSSLDRYHIVAIQNASH